MAFRWGSPLTVNIAVLEKSKVKLIRESEEPFDVDLEGLREPATIRQVRFCDGFEFMDAVSDFEEQGFRVDVRLRDVEYESGGRWLRLSHEAFVVP